MAQNPHDPDGSQKYKSCRQMHIKLRGPPLGFISPATTLSLNNAESGDHLKLYLLYKELLHEQTMHKEEEKSY